MLDYQSLRDHANSFFDLVNLHALMHFQHFVMAEKLSPPRGSLLLHLKPRHVAAPRWQKL
jgi:hypothetical protein